MRDPNSPSVRSGRPEHENTKGRNARFGRSGGHSPSVRLSRSRRPANRPRLESGRLLRAMGEKVKDSLHLRPEVDCEAHLVANRSSYGVQPATLRHVQRCLTEAFARRFLLDHDALGQAAVREWLALDDDCRCPSLDGELRLYGLVSGAASALLLRPETIVASSHPRSGQTRLKAVTALAQREESKSRDGPWVSKRTVSICRRRSWRRDAATHRR